MDNQTATRYPSLSSILIVAVILGTLVGLGVFQAAAKGYLPVQLSQQLTTQRTQTIVNEESAIISAVDKVSPSVVAISATQRKIDPFSPFSAPRSQTSTIGTGFVVSNKGIIVTNKHVVDNTGIRYTVISRDNKKFDIKKIYRDPVLDLAIVQVDDNSGLKPLDLGDSSKLKVGQAVIAIGNALGQFTNSVTTGVVSGLGRRVVAGDPYSGSSESLDNLIQSDAAINPGNSGGPLLNSAGQVIGVNVATTQGAQNIGFAIPINSVKQLVNDFATKGTVSRPFLGVRYTFITPDMGMMYNLPQGAYIQEVVPDSSADKVGIQAGEVITKIDRQAVNNESKISQTIAGKKAGDSLNLTVWSDGQEKQVNVTLQESQNQ